MELAEWKNHKPNYKVKPSKKHKISSHLTVTHYPEIVKVLSDMLIANEKGEIIDYTKILFNAIRHSHYDIVKYVLQRHDINNDKDENGNTVLHRVLQVNNNPIIDLVLMCPNITREYVNIKNEKENTALHEVCIYGTNVKAATYIIERTNDVQLKNCFGYTALMLALINDHVELAQLILSKEPYVAFRNTYLTENIFHLTVKSKHDYSCVFLCNFSELIASGHQIKQYTCRNDNIFHYVSDITINDLHKVLHSLSEYNLNYNHKNAIAQTPLHSACLRGNYAVIQYLLDRKADPTIKCHIQTPLHIAVADPLNPLCYKMFSKAPKELKYLHECYDITNFNPILRTAIHKIKQYIPTEYKFGIIHNNTGNNYMHYSLTNTEDFTIENDTDPTDLIILHVELDMLFSPNKYGLLPIHVAIVEGDWNLFENIYALRNDWDSYVNKKTSDNILHYVAKCKYKQSRKLYNLLLLCESYINRTNQHGETPLYVAVRNNNRWVVKLLSLFQADICVIKEDSETLLQVLMKNKNPNLKIFQTLVTSMISKKIDLDTANKNTITPLHIAIEHEHIDLIKLLIAYGASVNKTFNVDHTDNETYLHLVARTTANQKIYELLINHGANIDATNCHGFTPLHYAVIFDHVELAKYLLFQGADSTKTTEDFHFNALQLAVQKGNMEMVSVLQDYGSYPTDCSFSPRAFVFKDELSVISEKSLKLLNALWED